MVISNKIRTYIENASWIRRMFEEGARMKAEHGEENVFDFSLGNPTLEPPPAFDQALQKAVLEPPPGSHRYMPNTGYPETRVKIANYMKKIHNVPITSNHILMTVGAAGALNCTLKAVVDDGDEVIVLAPFFPEYRFYVANHGASLVVAETTEDFCIDVDSVAQSITEKTRALIVNSPNNPTGRIYSEKRLQALGTILKDAEGRFGRPIYLISDEPYRKVVYTSNVPSIYAAHKNSVICYSHSKDLGLPGERIGYAAINPACNGAAELFGAMAFTNRILGYVNAPALMQRVVADLQDDLIDPNIYRQKRDIFVTGLRDVGYEVVEPEGAFYLFPKSPIEDDVKFVRILAKHCVLGVPGQGFARGGHLRLSYCVDNDTIERSLPHFADALAETRAL